MLAVELRFRRVNGENLRTERPVPGVCPASPDPATLDDLTDAERAALATLREADEWGSGCSASSARLYWESLRQVNEWISGSAGAPVPEHPVLERARQGRPLRGVRAACVVRRRGPVILPAGPLMVTRSR
ncbi:hypothetical protein [Amycolatopsis kentuckyensis]|uniref:hypothetical protein n=1 Tax=Amycolatopsis kentuckyensis TaxID=218823 RepID=UPI00356B5464